MWTDRPLVRDAGAAVLTGVAAAVVLRFWEEVANRALLDQKLCRKLVHISVGLVYFLMWPLFSSEDMYAPFLAPLILIVNIVKVTVIGLSVVKDEGVVNSMTRHGDHRELLKGPLYYACAITLTTMVFWRTSPISIAVICNLCAGDVTLSKTKKKPGLERKGKVVAEIKDAVEQYSSAYVFTYDNMRNQKLKDLREQLKSSSRIFLAGKKVMQIALGRSPADEAKTGLHKLSKFLQGDSGLFFTNLPRDDVERLFQEFEEHDFARTGSTATETVELKEGPLEQFTHEMEPFLRKQGLPVRLNKGVVELVADHVVCEEGRPLSPEAAQTLRLLGLQMATFRLYLVCRWSCDDFEVYSEGLARIRAEDSS
ncbi:mRNA turnover protein 4 homolog isoform X2 [Panicum virgatum]|uniref:mRNA turnover protein 4 homolog isoform X2 n=1 Tax=Panicum virgatum TaxID=38727 RepID=UPI0019D5DB57|nr:mRNA turnover protein 4 homolog isoform X2 [Panicum virgatum]